MWHIDTTVIRLLDGTRAYLHAVIDNFSRRVLAWRVAETFAPMNSVAVLLDARNVPFFDRREFTPRAHRS
jgi:transposase InsO family protein